MRHNFVIFTLGDKQFLHRQANLAIISLLSRTRHLDNIGITILTDHPHWYEWISDHVCVEELGSERARMWKGPYDHFFRIKLKAIDYIANQYPGNVILLDCDVVAQAPLDDFFASLDRDNCFMDEMSYVLHQKSGRSKKMWVAARGKTYGKFTVDESSRMWNAGVVAIPESLKEEYIADALDCMDALCADGIYPMFLEQFALSLSLDRHGDLSTSESWFLHYWGNKGPWNALSSVFFSEIGLKGGGLEYACDRFLDLDLNMPRYIKRRRWERFLNSLMKRAPPRIKGISRDKKVSTAISKLLQT